MDSLPARAVRRCSAHVNALHSTVYFSPDIQRELGALGLEHHRAVYFASRAAALGRVGAGTVTAVFHSFKHELVAEHIPHAWDVVTPEEVLAARLRAADSTLRRVLGEELAGSPGTAEAAELALRAAEACQRAARPLYSANADLPVPDAPLLALWHATTLLREHRGDGHLMALTRAGLDPVEALVSHTATGRGMSLQWLARTRGWSEAELTAGQDRLRARGLLDADGGLTEAGAALREELEAETDVLDTAPYEHLGADDVARLTELMKTFTSAAMKAGAFPADLRG
ncbi:SCO6745 family protein [Streptomyces griseocarneus]|uniref:SCO6745 family protein n=1 Tax=Streptomyces griseocarneus TaxID=51201 RepID=UPI00167E4EC6|nr:hypothetical protein [Streptomyces griseocarneus]MBZ6472812.1 hypothetical protein [Streptomyces griseocarneus]GHG47468.1 hypothetical protein GCM10018779_04760 [Streptomyces griseocarneus]